MPSQVAHILFGQELIRICEGLLAEKYGQRFDEPIQKLKNQYFSVFALGCQGPDIFYHSQRRRPVAIEYGSLLHRRHYGSFMTVLLKRTLSSALTGLGAYALGFLTHAYLDRAAHPYIVYKAGWVSPERPETAKYARLHAFFERILDVQLLELLEGIHISAWNQDRILTRACEEPPVYLVETLADALRSTYPERAGKDPLLNQRIENALLDAASFYRTTNPQRTSMNYRKIDEGLYLKYDQTPASVALIYPEGFPLSVDYLNLAERPWRHPCQQGSVDHRSFINLFLDACQKGAHFLFQFISSFIETGHVPSNSAELIGNGGLSICDEAGQPCKPVWSDPLPLDHVLEQQFLLRTAWFGR
ncbi:MAG: zinc dependent phospholipase C family protein [Treponema sp.]|nr:zinc dependent phospholipase C family protein [Treponema sp.]